MTFEDHFSEQAKLYAQSRPTYPPALFAYLASLAPARDLAWDCGTGNGQAALELAEHFRQVVATDASAEQIENAFPHERVTYRVEAAEETSFAPHSVDLTTVGTAVHWFDFDAFYAEVRRVTKPGGVLAVWTYHLAIVEPAVDDLLERYYRQTLAGYWPERIRYLEERYRTLPFPLTEIDPPPFEMEADWDLNALLGFLNSWSATRRFLESEGRHPLVPLKDKLQEAWGDPEQKRHVRWPLHFRIGRVSP
jgi:SAM-dependent methyltransferase